MYDILSMNPAELEGLMKELNQPMYRAGQIFNWLHKKNATSFFDMTNLSKNLRAELETCSYIASVETVKKLESKNDGTIKYLFELNDKTLIESVLMKYSHGNTVCVSTQAGCKMGCYFCASGTEYVRDLTPGEICAQVYEASKNSGKIGGVVLMGCGEPLDNFKSVIHFIEQITHPEGLNIGQRHITLSTCGLVPEIIKLADLKLQITLAISLHAPSDEVRKTFMPIAKKHTLKEIISACRYYIKKTNRRITFEYALTKGVNDSPLQAKELIKLIRGLNCHVNLIPVNKTQGEFAPTPRNDIQAFADILIGSRIQTTIRRSLGADVNAACGQLRATERR